MKITTEHIRFLDDRIGQDLIVSVHAFRVKFDLSHHETSMLVNQWMDI